MIFSVMKMSFRATFSPIFTFGKLKVMVKFINLVSHQLVGEVAEAAKTGNPVDMKNLCGKYSMDTIASCAFGVNAGSFDRKETTFVDNARGVFSRLRDGWMWSSLLAVTFFFLGPWRMLLCSSSTLVRASNSSSI